MEDTQQQLMWRKARASGSNGGNCVEIGATPCGTAAGIRDSKSPERGHLTVTPAIFAAFLARIKSGELDA